MSNKSIINQLLFVLFFCFLFPSLTYAVTVRIDPGDFENAVWSHSSSGPLRHWGPANIEWDEGQTYHVQPGWAANTSFTVTAEGIVPTHPDAVIISEGIEGADYTITLKTTPIDIILNGYKGSIAGAGVYRATSDTDEDGVITTHVVPGISGNYGISFQHAGAHFTFVVSSDGTVASISTQEVADINGNQISLNTSPVTINPGDYLGYVRMWETTTPQFAGGVFNDTQTFELPVGLEYKYTIGGISVLSFDLDSNGYVTSNNPGSAVGGQNMLTFINSPAFIDVGNYEGAWTTQLRWVGETYWWQYSSKEYMLVPGVTYAIRIHSVSSIRFDFDANGDVATVYGTDEKGAYTRISGAAFGQGNSLVFNNVNINIDPNGISTGVHLGAAFPREDTGRNVYHMQPIEATLVPDLDFNLLVGSATTKTLINIDSLGNVSPHEEVSGTGGVKQFTFNTETIEITPVNFAPSKHWVIGQLGFYDGLPQTITLMPGVDYRTIATNSNHATFSLFSPCAVLPEILTFNDKVDNSLVGELHLDCELPVLDYDQDGIPDEIDNCPVDANEEQIDFDGDLVGDVCDDDRDGDNINNYPDNCPDFPNPDQLDSDGDLIGDACDDDRDGDGISDEYDNCPYISNHEQSDSDGDGLGDVCDEDDDNDNVLDIFDNCPVDANSNQNDFDGNGEGDVCDGDIDGDGVHNDFDICPDSPKDGLVNEEGCNGSQLIAMSCIIDDFSNHGRYVSCVAAAANDAVDQGLITNKEKSLFVKEAAKQK